MRIIRNSAQCLKCLDTIESKHVHDFRWCKCGSIAVDGGKAYLKRVGPESLIRDTSERSYHVSAIYLAAVKKYAEVMGLHCRML